MTLLPALPKSRPEEVGLDSEALEKHSAAVRRHIEKGWSYGIVECVLKDNRLVYLDAVGLQDVELGKPMTNRSLFRCYSMTKPVTAFGLLVLWEEGKLSFDDPVAKYIPEFQHMKVLKDPMRAIPPGPRGGGLADAKKLITLRNLLTHTSGLGYGPWRDDRSKDFKPYTNPVTHQYREFVEKVDSGKIKNLEAYCRELAKQPLRFEPGDQWLYGFSMDVVGRVLEVVSNKPLDQFLNERVFKPIGMRDTAFFISPTKARKQLAAYYKVKKRWQRDRFDGRRPEESSWVKGLRPHILSGGGYLGSCDGGLVSSARDQALFANVLANMGYACATQQQVLQKSTVRMGCKDWLRLKSVTTQYPLKGWHDQWGEESGWAPLGITEGDNIYMGGVGYWSANLRDKTIIVTFPSTSWDTGKYRGWMDEVDDIESAIKKAEEIFREKANTDTGALIRSAKRHKRC